MPPPSEGRSRVHASYLTPGQLARPRRWWRSSATALAEDVAKGEEPDSDADGADAAAPTTTRRGRKAGPPSASLRQTLGFVWACGPRVRCLFVVGLLAAFLNGLVYPVLAYLFSTSFTDLSSAANGLDNVRRLAFTFLIVGAFALGAATVQAWAFEIVAHWAARDFRLRWFRALLRQDAAFFDAHDAAGTAGQMGGSAGKFRRGVGRKFGEGVQFFTTGVGGIAYAFFASWRVALVVLCAVPLASLAALMVMNLNQTKGRRAAESYRRAGGVAYAAVSAVKTVLSLNGVLPMVRQYRDATEEAFHSAVRVLLKQGFANGAMLGSFLLLYCILTLYGTALLYRGVSDTGCDPSGAMVGNEACPTSGSDVFGAMLGVAFAAQGVSQVGNFFEALAQARTAAAEALLAIDRLPGAPGQVVYKPPAPAKGTEDRLGATTRSHRSSTGSDRDRKDDNDAEAATDTVLAILPPYEIDSSSRAGLRPPIHGAVQVQDVHFAYPTRPDDPVLEGMTLDIEAGQTVAFVGPSGSGKSTIVAMLERFYDPASGAILLDGMNLKDINVRYLRGNIGYVGQEPALFATSIRANIRYGNPRATDEEIEEASRLANAHEFISSFSDGYDTQVGDKGSQLSGGQKQRIAIARVLVGRPRILLLDEATSALDSESELVVQDALDNVMEKKKLTTIIIAHRLSTIRNADKIFVVVGGRVVEQGTHDELMEGATYYRRLVEKQDGKDTEALLTSMSRNASVSDLQTPFNACGLVPSSAINKYSSRAPVHIEFRDVCFSYPSRPKKPIFDNFNLKIRQGETVALVGPSGGGKSTTVGLVERFYDPAEGTVEYLGTDLKALNVSWYRSQLAYVGQEPTLFNMTIAENIAFGIEGGVSRAEIEEAARQANAHDFIMSFPEGYETPVGARGTQLSGGQKQRVAIARALVRKPRVLILDEATSALDNESESIVQEAINRLMHSSEHTCIVIAHRLSTIRNADSIAFIADGKVLEQGTHEELTQLPHGRYKRLFESSKRRSTLDSVGLRKSQAVSDSKDANDGKKGTDEDEEDEEEEINWEEKIREEEEKAFNGKRARAMARPDAIYMLVGSIGAVLAGGVFPMWGILFGQTIELLFRPILPCSDDAYIPNNMPSCEAYWDAEADYMRERSFRVAGYWVLLCIIGCMFGNMVTFYGFGTASERLAKRIRDAGFLALMRQEPAFFDKRSVGAITSQLQDDAARIQAFSGEPVRSFIIAMASIITGIVLSLYYMWPFALLAIGCIPVMAVAVSVQHANMMGTDESAKADAADELNSPGGIVVETLLNIRTVAALTLEARRYGDYERALAREETNYRKEAFMGGLTNGLSMFVQQWINGLQMYFGGYLLFKFPDQYDLGDFLIAQFSILFGLFGLGAAFQDMSDRKEVEKSAGRIFYLLDRESAIDPLSRGGAKLK